MAYKRKKGRSIVKKNKKSLVHNGVTYRSGLELYMARALEKAKVKFEYEEHTYILVEGFKFEHSAFERYASGKKPMIDRGHKKVLPITYKPDFVGVDFIIETKGYANEAFKNRWKLFKKYVQENLPGFTLYKPQNQAECDRVIQLIKNGHKET